MADVSPLSRVREVSKAVPAVAENIATSRQPVGRFKAIDRAVMIQSAAQPFTRLGVSTDLDRPARGLDLVDRPPTGSNPAPRYLADHFSS
jgi:hypothetical protein